jgi:hypothetical protein
MSVYCAMMKALQQHQHIWEINIQEPSCSSSCWAVMLLPVRFGDRRLSGEYMASRQAIIQNIEHHAYNIAWPPSLPRCCSYIFPSFVMSVNYWTINI